MDDPFYRVVSLEYSTLLRGVLESTILYSLFSTQLSYIYIYLYLMVRGPESLNHG